MKINKLALNTFSVLFFYSFCEFALAQAAGGLAAPVSAKLNTVQTALTAVGAVTVTIALIYVGMKMVFQAAEWKDVAPVFWGGVLIGGAAVLGRVLIT